jgi:hypothetical protein
MFESLEAKAIASTVLTVLLILAVVGFAWHERNVGADGVQAKWDLANAQEAKLTVHASETARAAEHQQAADFAGIATTFLQATTHAYPSIADTLPAAVAAGTVQLRDACPAPDRGGVSAAAAASRERDAAATQALADRVADSIAAVRAGDDADAREQQLDAKINALQAVLRAERNPLH